MASPVFDAVSSNTDTDGDASWSHTIGGGSDRILVVCVNNFDSFGGGDVNGVTFDGVAMTKRIDVSQVVAATLRSEIWYMLEADLPAAGSYTVAVDFVGDFGTSASGGISLSNADQASPEATGSNKTSTTGSLYTGSIITLTDDAMIINSVSAGTPASVSPTAGQTERFDLVISPMAGSANTFVQATAGSKILTGNFVGTVGGYTHALISVAPGGGGPPGTPDPNAIMFGANS